MATLQGSISVLFTATSQQLTQTVQAIGAQFEQLKTKIQGSVDTARQNTAQLNLQLEKTPKLLKMTTTELHEFRKASEGIYFAGLHLGMIGSVLTAFAALPVARAAQFEQALSKIASVTENASARMGDLAKQAIMMGQTTQFSAVQAAEGLFVLGKAGLSATESMTALPPVLYLAVVGETDLATAADIAANAMRAMQLTVYDLAHITDALANTANVTTSDVKDLAEALKYAAPPAAAAGLSIDTLSAVLGVLGNNGIKASLAGTSLRGMLASLVSPSAKAQKTLEQLGVSVQVAADGSIDLMKVLEDLGRASMTLAEANAIFDRRSAASALALSKQIGTVKELAETNRTATGTAKEMARVMQDNLAGAFTRLKAAADTLAIAIGSSVLSPLRAMVEALAGATRGMGEFAKTMAGGIISGTILSIAGSLAILLTAFSGLQLAIGAWGRLMAVLATGTAGRAILTLAVAFKNATGAVIAYNVAAATALGTTNTFSIAVARLNGLLMGLWAIVVAHPFVALAAAILAVVAGMSVWAKKEEELRIAHQASLATLQDYSRALTELKNQRDQAQSGSDAQKKSALDLKKSLEEVADSNKTLSKFAREAAASIDIETGAFNDGGKAANAFFDALRSEKMADLQRVLVDANVELTQFDNNINTVGRSWAKLTGYLKGIATLGIFGRDLFGVDVGAALEEREKKFITAETAIRKQIRLTIQEAVKLNEVDLSMNAQQATAWLDQTFGKLGKYRYLATEVFGDIVVSAVKTSEARKAVEGKTNAEIAANYRQMIDFEIAAVSGLKAEYDRLRASSDITSRTEAYRKFSNEVVVLKTQLSALGKTAVLASQEELDKEVAAIDRAVKTAEFSKQQGEIKTAAARVNAAQRVVEINGGLVASAKKALGEEHAVTLQFVQQEENAREQLGKKVEALSDEQLTAWNKGQTARLRMQEKFDEEYYSKAKNSNEKFDNLLRIRLEAFRRKIAEDEKEGGIKIPVSLQLQGEAAIRQKIEDERAKWLADEAKNKIRVDVILKENAINLMKEELNTMIIVLEKLRALGGKSNIEVIDETSIARIRIATEELKKMEDELVKLEGNTEEVRGTKERLAGDIAVQKERIKGLGEARIAAMADAQTKEQKLRDDFDMQMTQRSLDLLLPGQLEEKNALELKMLRQKHEAQIAEIARAGLQKEELERRLNQTAELQRLELDKKERDQAYATMQYKMDIAKSAAGYMVQMGADLTALTGENNKKMFKLNKALAIAQIAINTAAAVMSAWATAGNPYIAAGFTVVIMAAGAAATAKVLNQQMPEAAEGGRLPGSAPHDKADNIVFRGTPGEFVQPVATVRHYGEAVMEGLRRRSIPKAIFAGVSQGVSARVAANRRAAPGAIRRYAEGGQLQSVATGMSTERGQTSKKDKVININNIVDPTLVGQYLASTPGEMQILNIINNNAFKIRSLLSG